MSMILIHDARIPEPYISALSVKFPGIGFVPLRVTRCYDSISSHPDIYFFQIDDRTLIHAPCIAEETLKLLRAKGVCLIKGEIDPSGKYPNTALYNAVRLGNVVLHKLDLTDSSILYEAGQRGMRTVDVPQGYSRCSVVRVSDNAIITSDEGIAMSARMEGIDVLKISAGGVDLPGEKYGFLGGACGVTPLGETVFLGDIRLHKDGGKIKAFYRKHGSRHSMLEDLPLYDSGSLIFVYRMTVHGRQTTVDS